MSPFNIAHTQSAVEAAVGTVTPMRQLGDLLVKNAIETPEKVAIVHRDRRVTHRQLLLEAHRVASGLDRLHGLGGNRIAILLPNSPEFLFAYFGAALSGNIVIPLDHTLPPEEIPYLLNNSQSSCLITCQQFLSNLLAIGSRATALQTVITVDEPSGLVHHPSRGGLGSTPSNASPVEPDSDASAAWVAGVDKANRVNVGTDPSAPSAVAPELGRNGPGEAKFGCRVIAWKDLVGQSPPVIFRRPVASPDDVVVFLYTSGTTGFPRAAMCTHANLLSNVATEAELYGLGPQDVFSCVLPMFHNYSIVDTCLLPLWYGATIVIGELDDTEGLLRTIERERVTFLATTPSQLSEMAFLRFSKDHDTSSLRMVQTGGAPLPTEVQTRFQERFHLPIIEGYGCSEASSTVTVVPMQGPYKPSSVGKVMPNQQIRIVDADDRDTGSGDVGEVLVRGPNVCQGYYGQPDETASAFRHGWLHTGDLGRVDDEGFLFIVGRMEATIDIGGHRIYPTEVESILRQLDGVLDACVVAAVDGDSNPCIKAFLETRDGMHIHEDAVIEHCRGALAQHKVPHRVEFRNKLPRTGIGKISRRRLLMDS